MRILFSQSVSLLQHINIFIHSHSPIFLPHFTTQTLTLPYNGRLHRHFHFLHLQHRGLSRQRGACCRLAPSRPRYVCCGQQASCQRGACCRLAPSWTRHVRHCLVGDRVSRPSLRYSSCFLTIYVLHRPFSRGRSLGRKECVDGCTIFT